MTRETYCPEKIKGLEVISIENKTIVLPFEEATYDDVVALRGGLQTAYLWRSHAPDTTRATHTIMT